MRSACMHGLSNFFSFIPNSSAPQIEVISVDHLLYRTELCVILIDDKLQSQDTGGVTITPDKSYEEVCYVGHSMSLGGPLNKYRTANFSIETDSYR